MLLSQSYPFTIYQLCVGRGHEGLIKRQPLALFKRLILQSALVKSLNQDFHGGHVLGSQDTSGVCGGIHSGPTPESLASPCPTVEDEMLQV